MLFEPSYGVRRCLEPSLRCFLPRCFFSPYKSAIQMAALLEAMCASRTCGLGGARAHLTRAGRLCLPYRTLCVCQVGAPPPPDHRFVSLQVVTNSVCALRHQLQSQLTLPRAPHANSRWSPWTFLRARRSEPTSARARTPRSTHTCSPCPRTLSRLEVANHTTVGSTLTAAY